MSYQALSPVLAETSSPSEEAGISTDSQGETLVIEESGPQQTVEELHAGLLVIMQGGDEMGFEGRHTHIAPIVEETFDITRLAGSAIGLSIWRKWDDDQKRGYVNAFREFLTTNYASQFRSFAGQTFETLAMEEGPQRGTKIVRTHLTRPDNEPVALDYLTREKDGAVGIVDIFLNGSVSEAARRRAEFTAVYRDQGYEGLMDAITTLIEDNKNRTDNDITG